MSIKYIAVGILAMSWILVPVSLSADVLAIVNGDFETGSDGDSSHTPIAGWTDNGAAPGFWLTGGFSGAPSSAYDGNLYLSGKREAGGATSQPVSSTLNQTIVLSEENLSLVQSGSSINLSWVYADGDSADSVQIDIRFLDGASGELGAISSGLLPDNGGGWTLENLSGPVPPSTVAVRIEITSARTGGTAHDVHVDALEGSMVSTAVIIDSLSPAYGAQITTNDLPLSLGAVLVDGSSSVDISSIGLMLDGVALTLAPDDVVKTATTTTVHHAVSSPGVGAHRVSVVFSATSPAAGPFTNTWSFSMPAAPGDLPKPPICPRWAFEPWVWEDNENTQTSTMNLVAGYQQRNIPVGAVMIDSPWETTYNSFEWDAAKYPDPAQMISDLNAEGVRVLLWITGAQNKTSTDTSLQKSPYFDFVVSNDYAINGGAVDHWWKGDGVHIDFTNPEACDWFGSLMGEMMDLGVDGWKADQAEDWWITTVDTSIGTMHIDDFKPYYYGALRDQAFNHNPESLILARPYSTQVAVKSDRSGFCASIDQCTVGWSGDYHGNFAGLESQMSALYISAHAGYGVLSVEVGGYQGSAPSKESLIRYTQFGALMPVMENGGSNGGLAQHLPWYWDTETTDIYRYYATLHSELAPYLFSTSVDSHLQGGSSVKSADYANRQHRLGEQLFTSLVTTSATSKDVVLPSKGAWIDYWNEDQLYTPGTAMSVPAPLDTVPLYVKAGAIIPMNVRTNLTGHGDVSSIGKDTLLIYPFGESSYTYHRSQGSGIEYDNAVITVNEEAGTLAVSGSTKVSYRFRIKCFSPPSNVSGADAWTYDAVNQVVIVDKQGAAFSVNIQGLQAYSTKATNFELWQERYAIAGPFDADADTNRVVDGVEYYLGSNPTDPFSPDHILTWSSNYLSVAHPYNPLASGVTGTVEWTADLTSSNWNFAGVTYTTSSSPYKIEAMPGIAGTNQLFIRLKVSH